MGAGEYLDRATGAPGEILEFRIAYLRVGSPVFAVAREDELPANIVLATGVDGAGADLELVRPDGEVVLLSTGLMRNIRVELAEACDLRVAVRCDGTLAEAILDGDAGTLRFHVLGP